MIDVKILKRPKQGNLISSSGGFATAGTATVMPTDCLQKLTRVLVPVDADQNELTWDAPLDKIFAIKSVKGIYSLEFLSARGLNSAESGVTGGINESELAQYLIDNNYAKKSDIPSLAGFATESWVKEQKYLTSLAGFATESWVKEQKYLTSHQSLAAYLKSADAASTYLTKTDAADTYQPLENGKGLSSNDFTDALLTKLKGIEEGANKYVHPSHTIRNIAAAAGLVLASVSVDAQGHVTAVGSKTLVATDIPVLSISKISGLQTTLDAKLEKSIFEEFKGKFDEMFMLETVNGVRRIKANYGLYTGEFLSARGLNPSEGSSSAGGSGFGRLDLWSDYTSGNTDALSAKLGYALYTGLSSANSNISALSSRVAALEGKNYLDALTLSMTGTGNAVTSASLSADKKTLTLTKGSTFLTSHQSLANYYTKSEVDTKVSNYLPLTGGTIKRGTTVTPLLINTDSTVESGIGFQLGGTSKGWVGYNHTNGVEIYNYASAKYIGVKDDGTPHYCGNVLWHQGNDGSGSGLDADLLDGLHHYAFAKANQSPTVDLNTVNGIGMMCNTANANATSERHYPIQEAGCLIYCTAAYSSANQIYGSYNSNRWFARGGAGWDTDHPKTNWREFAFTDSNVASATKLQTARTLWGQSFDGTGNVNGLLTINYTGETGLALYRKEAGSGAFMRFYNANQTANYFRLGMYGDNHFGISYNSGLNAIAVLTNGNVGIGNESPAYKLDVNGVIRANNEIISTSANAFRMVYGNYGAFFRNDGNYTYLLLTASGNQYGSFNSLRPFYVNNSSGLVTMGNGLSVNKITIGSCTITYENGGLHFSSGIYSDGFVSAKGVNSSGSGSGTGVSYNRLDNWTDYATGKEGYVLSAKLGYDLYSNKADKSALSNYVTLNTAQTITGVKTFTKKLIVAGDWTNDNGLYLYESKDTTVYGGYVLYGASDKLHLGTWNNSTTGVDALQIARGSADVTFLGKIIKSGGTATQALMADGSVRVVNILSSVTNLGWSGTSGQLATINTLAFWNGCYVNTSSNLQYCDRGRFGTMATATATDYLARSGGSMTNTNLVTNLNADLLDGVHLANVNYCLSSFDFKVGSAAANITTAQFIEKLTSLGAFNYRHWTVKCTWAYANNDTITDSGFGNIQLAGAVIEVWSQNSTTYTIKITTSPTTSNGGIANAVFVYRNHGSGYSPNWRHMANTYNNVASATKLQTARTLWGQSFDGTGNVNGLLTINYTGETGLALYRKEAGSGAFMRFYNANQTANYFRLGMYGDNHFGIFSSVSGADAINVQSNGHVLVGNTSTASYALNTASFICDSWIRSKGATGWYNETYGGGWYMTDTTWIRNYNNKSLYMSTATIRTDYLFDRQGYGGASWNNGYGAYNTAITNNSSQTPLMVAYRAGQTPAVTGDNRLFAMELLNSGSELHLSFKGVTKYNFSSGGNLTTPANIYCASIYPTNMVRFPRAEGNSHYLEMNTSSDRLLFCQMTNNTFVEARAWISWDGVFYAKTGIYSNGYVSARGQNTSDVRLKDQIQDFRATEILKALHPKAFKWNTVARHKFKVFDTDDVQYGLIAQEAKGVAPWLVAERLFDDDYLSIHYHKLIPVLHKGFIEHEDEITKLRRRVAELEKEVEQLKIA